MTFRIQTLDGLVLSETAGIRRDTAVPPEYRDARFHQVFDATTLFYDCVYLDHDRGYLFTGPVMSNLWPVLQAGLRLDGRPVSGLKLRHVQRVDQAFLRAPKGGRLSFEGYGSDREIVVRPSLTPVFAGRDVLMTLSKDNPLDWIVEWARFYVRRHGATGLLFFDNMSTAYTAEDLLETVRSRTGLQAAAVIRVPYRYGDFFAAGDKVHRLMFLQPALLNLARRDMAWKARAALNVDIDEMIIGLPGAKGTLYDETARSLAGGVRFRGFWRYPARDGVVPCLQHDSTQAPVPDKVCNHKWCARPRSLASRLGGWNVHAFGAGYMKWHRKRKIDSRRFELRHCMGTTTSWKPDSPRFAIPPEITPDTEMAAEIAATLD